MDLDGALQLTNSGYLENQTRFYNELLESQEMSDVTLGCDGYEIGAHKTIISASSLFFREVIRKSKHPNPYIYLKGVSKEVLEVLLKFIYNGEVTARSAILQNLVDVGNELQIEGLMELEEKSKTNEKTRKKEKDVIESHQKDMDNSDFNVADLVKIEPYEIMEHEEENCEKQGFVDAENHSVGTSNNKEELAEEIAKRMVEIFDEQGVKQFECLVCHKRQCHKIKMKMHVETHLEGLGFSHTCKVCGLVKKTTRALQLHVYNQHTRSKSGKADVIKTE